MPPMIIAAGVAAAGSIAGGAISASAAGAAGDAQVAAAKQGLSQQQAARQQGVQLGYQVGGQSPSEIAAIQKLYASNESMFQQSFGQLSKQQQLLDSSAPNVQSAGTNLLNLLNGQSAPMLQAYQAQVEQQRNEFKSQLEGQFGPGWASSTAGIQAMTQFNQSTAMNTAQIQQQAIGQLTSTYGNLFGQQFQGQSDITRQTGNIFSQYQTNNAAVLQANQYDQTRLSNAVMSGFNLNQPNFQAPTTVAGAPFAGQSDFGHTIAGLGGIGLGVAVNKLGGQQSPTGDGGAPAGGSPTGSNYSFGSFNYSPMSGNLANGYVGGQQPNTFGGLMTGNT